MGKTVFMGTLLESVHTVAGSGGSEARLTYILQKNLMSPIPMTMWNPSLGLAPI